MTFKFGGGGGKSVLQNISFINSTTWSPAQDMNAKIYVIGGGGSGGGSNAVATGGGAGNPPRCRPVVWLPGIGGLVEEDRS